MGVPVARIRERRGAQAPRASSPGRRRSRPVLTAHGSAPTRAPWPRCAGQPWAPARLAAPEFAQQEPPPAPLSGAPRLNGKGQKSALAKASDTAVHGMPAGSRREASWRARKPNATERNGQFSALGQVRDPACASADSVAQRAARAYTGSDRERVQSPHVSDVHARLRERTSMFSLQSEETSPSGAAGVAVSRFRERRGAQAPRVAPRSGAEERESALIHRPSARACYADDLATKPWAPSTAAQSREGRRPQPTADA